MRICITGGAGFIGSHVAELFSRKQHELLILDDLSTGNMALIEPLLKNPKRIHFDLCDIRNRSHVHCALMAFRPEVICHLAAQSAVSNSWDDPAFNAQVNEVGTLNLIESAVAFGARKILFASTSAVYDDWQSGRLHEYSL